MKKQPMRATGLVAAGVVAGGILAGTLGAQAANQANDQSDDRPGTTAELRMHGAPGGPGGPDGPRFMFRAGGEDLAKELGVSDEKLQKAFEDIRDDVRPPAKPTGPPSDADLAAMESKIAAALAKELGLSESKVSAALEKVHKEHEAERRAALSDRLDAAVKAGKLTSDDKASVLKAFDAGVLGGPGRP